MGAGVEWGLVWSGGWCGVEVVVSESIEFSEYPCEFARTLPNFFFRFLWGGGKHTLVSHPSD